MSRDLLQYKSYLGFIRYDDEEEVFRGRVIDIKDMVTFQGSSVEEIRREFQESIDDYVEFCTGLGQEPDKPSRSSVSETTRNQKAEPRNS